MKTILFLCTGNYYRSRFAENLFNSLAGKEGLDWKADSRGLALDRGNLGPISPYTITGLAERGITLAKDWRNPIAVTATDLEQADRVIAMDEPEHRPLMTAKFPEWTDRIEYWHIQDLTEDSTESPLNLVEKNLTQLMVQLGGKLPT